MIRSFTPRLRQPRDASALPLAADLQHDGVVSILVVDDSAFDRRRIRRLSEQSDLAVNVVEIAGLSELPGALAAHRFDVILLDYSLGKGTGIEALKLIRSDARHGACPIIMVAGEERSSHIVSAMRGGCLDFLAKRNLTVDRLQKSIEYALDNRPGATSGPEVTRVADHARDILSQQVRGLNPDFQSVIRDMRALRVATAGQPDTGRGLRRLEHRLVALWDLLGGARSGQPLN